MDGLWINVIYSGRSIHFISDKLPLPGPEQCTGNLESIFYLLFEHLIYHIPDTAGKQMPIHNS